MGWLKDKMWSASTLIKVGDVDFYLRHYNIHWFDLIDSNETLGIVAKVKGFTYRNVIVEVSNYTNFNMFTSLLILKDSLDQEHREHISHDIAPTDVEATGSYIAIRPINGNTSCAILGPGEKTEFNVRYNGHINFCDFVINAEQVQASAEEHVPFMNPDFASSAGGYIRVDQQDMSRKTRKRLKYKTVLNPLLRLDRMSCSDFTRYLGKSNESDAVALTYIKAESYFNDTDTMFLHRTFSVFLTILIYELYKFHLLKRGWKVSALLASPVCFDMMKIKVYRLANTLMYIDTNFNEDFFEFKDEQSLKAHEKEIYGLVELFLGHLRSESGCLPTEDSVTIDTNPLHNIKLSIPFNRIISVILHTTARYLSTRNVSLRTATGLSMEKSHHDVTVLLNNNHTYVVFYKYNTNYGAREEVEGDVVIIQLSNGYVLRGDKYGRVFTTDSVFTRGSLNNRNQVDDRFWFVFKNPRAPLRYFIKHVLSDRFIKHDGGLSLGVPNRIEDLKFQFTVTSLE